MASNIISDGYHRSDEANTDSEEYEESHGTALAAQRTGWNVSTAFADRRCGGPFAFQRGLDPVRGVSMGWNIELCDNFYRKFDVPKLYEITLEGGGRTAEYAVR